MPDVRLEYIGYNFEEKIRWGDQSKRVTDFSSFYSSGSYLAAETRRKQLNVHEQQQKALADKLYVAPEKSSPAGKPNFKIEKKAGSRPLPQESKEDNELMKKFAALKAQQGERKLDINKLEAEIRRL